MVILTLFLVSCGSHIVDASLRGELLELEEKLGIGVDYSVVEENLSGSRTGFCQYFPYRKVFIDVGRLNEIGKSVKLTLLHEIGHCTFKKSHVDRQAMPDGCPEHIMMQGMKHKHCEAHLDTYLTQLKGEK